MGKDDALRMDWGALGGGSGTGVCRTEAEVLMAKGERGAEWRCWEHGVQTKCTACKCLLLFYYYMRREHRKLRPRSCPRERPRAVGSGR